MLQSLSPSAIMINKNHLQVAIQQQKSDCLVIGLRTDTLGHARDAPGLLQPHVHHRTQSEEERGSQLAKRQNQGAAFGILRAKHIVHEAPASEIAYHRKKNCSFSGHLSALQSKRHSVHDCSRFTVSLTCCHSFVRSSTRDRIQKGRRDMLGSDVCIIATASFLPHRRPSSCSKACCNAGEVFGGDDILRWMNMRSKNMRYWNFPP